jgi:hypothetical protein
MEKQTVTQMLIENLKLTLPKSLFNDVLVQDIFKEALEIEKEQKKLELPTDEEIDAYVKSTGYYGHCTDEFHEGIELGAKWMRDKIKGGNNE